MELNEFLLEGGSIGFPYKEKKRDLLATTRISILSGHNTLPRVFVDTNVELKTFPLEELDKAIDYYIAHVLCDKNLWYKMSPTLREFNLREEWVDLDIDEDYEKVNKLRITKY